MKLTIISGLSGSGKTVALHALEDEGYYCIDNLPVALVQVAVESLLKTESKIALGIDARSVGKEQQQFDLNLTKIRELGVEIELIYLQAQEEVLLKRFSETRRMHPLSRNDTESSLIEAIRKEKSLLTEIAGLADLTIDTSVLNIHDLSRQIRERLHTQQPPDSGLSVLVQSFGFKHGVPLDSDFVFDVRCLPNPHWEAHLRHHSGKDKPVIDYLQRHDDVGQMLTMIQEFLTTWIPRFADDNRRYLSVSIGCTGGQHRSVFLAEQIGQHLQSIFNGAVTIRHRDLA